MASGVAVSDEVVCCFNDMKVRKSCSQADLKKRKKAVLFKLDDSKEKIIVDQEKQITVGDVLEQRICDPLNSFIKMLPLNDCRYALYDASFETKETKKEELIFMHWVPEDASVACKMIYASSKDALKKKFTGVKHEWQVTSIEELMDRCELASKLGSGVIAFESQKI
ncbi:cofilin-2-like [Stegostoma tigrinum]|uniref:cofilin-2-like n=1 Tax=Stegostoma tigrinum TaxID=3053191 RepID=UPI00202B8200|nr:cofilin-2-like [Stegostoma tigrinum]